MAGVRYDAPLNDNDNTHTHTPIYIKERKSFDTVRNLASSFRNASPFVWSSRFPTSNNDIISNNHNKSESRSVP